MFLRGAVFTLIGLVSILVLLLLVLRSAKFLRSNRRLAAFVLVALVIVMLVSTAAENPLRYIPCCGDGPTTHWGYPYAWLSCGSYALCDWPRVDWLAVLANLLFAANITLISTSTLALFRKDVLNHGTALSAS